VPSALGAGEWSGLGSGRFTALETAAGGHRMRQSGPELVGTHRTRETCLTSPGTQRLLSVTVLSELPHCNKYARCVENYDSTMNNRAE